MTEIVKQRHSFDCAVACIAMLAQVSYEAVAARHKKTLEALQGLHFMEIFESLKHFCLQPCVLHTFPYPNPCILIVPSLNGEGRKHAIFWDGNAVVDPAIGKIYDTTLLLKNGSWSVIYGSLKNEQNRGVYEFEKR